MHQEIRLKPFKEDLVVFGKRGLTLALVLVLLLVVAVPAAAGTSALIRTRVVDNAYRPRMNSGLSTDTFGWRNFGPDFEHTVTSTTGAFDSGVMAIGTVFSISGLAPGTYNYFCLIHPSMTGRIIVN